MKKKCESVIVTILLAASLLVISPNPFLCASDVQAGAQMMDRDLQDVAEVPEEDLNPIAQEHDELETDPFMENDEDVFVENEMEAPENESLRDPENDAETSFQDEEAPFEEEWMPEEVMELEAYTEGAM